jgi:hypothetical protein
MQKCNGIFAFWRHPAEEWGNFSSEAIDRTGDGQTQMHGKLTVNVEPRPGWLSTQMLPP